MRNLDGRRSRWSGHYGNIRSAVFDCLSYLTDAFYFCNDFLDGTVFIEIRIDCHVDRAFLGQQVARYHGAVVASDGDVGESVVRADFRIVIEERHREVRKRGALFFRCPEVIHRQLAAGRIEDIGFVGNLFLRCFVCHTFQCVERRRKILEDHGHGIGLQLGGNIAEVIGLDVQLAERAFEYPACLVERGFNLVVLLAEEECVEPFLVAFIFFGTDLCKTGLRIVILVDSVICTVCPEHEVVGLLGHQTQVTERGLTAGYGRDFPFAVQCTVPIDFQNTAVDH